MTQDHEQLPLPRMPSIEEIEAEEKFKRRYLQFKEGGEYHDRTTPFPDRWFVFLANVAFLFGFFHWMVGPSSYPFFLGISIFFLVMFSVACVPAYIKDEATEFAAFLILFAVFLAIVYANFRPRLPSDGPSFAVPFILGALFFAFLTLLPLAALSLPTVPARSFGLVVVSIAILVLLWSGWFFLIWQNSGGDEPPRRPLVLNRVDKLIYEYNLTVGNEQQVPLGEPRSVEEEPELAPFLSPNPFEWLLPQGSTTITMPDGQTIEGHLFQSEEEAAEYYGLWLPFKIALFCFPAIFLSIPYINVIVEAFVGYRFVVYAATLVAIMTAMSLFFLPPNASHLQTIVLTSILGSTAIGFRLLLGCNLENTTLWIGAHVWGAVTMLFCGYLLQLIGFSKGVGIPVVFAVGLFIHMSLPFVLSPMAYQRTQRVFHVLGVCLRWAPIVILAGLMIHSWWVGPRETGNNAVDQWITTPSEQPAE